MHGAPPPPIPPSHPSVLTQGKSPDNPAQYVKCWLRLWVEVMAAKQQLNDLNRGGRAGHRLEENTSTWASEGPHGISRMKEIRNKG